MNRQPRFLVDLELREVGDGDSRGLFVTQTVPQGRTVLEFGGALLDRGAMLALSDRHHYLQIGPQVFLGPSGDLDDYVNHSCGPSTRVAIDPRSPAARLVAHRDLDAGEEVTFDYSTVQLGDRDSAISPCRCGTVACRDVVQDFSLMLPTEQERLVRTGLCAWYLVDAWEGVNGDGVMA